MIARYNNISLAFGVPGIILQIAGNVMARPGSSSIGAGIAVLLVGTVLLIVGLAYYAKAKGRSEVWCLMGFLSLIGLIVLAMRQGVAGAELRTTTTSRRAGEEGAMTTRTVRADAGPEARKTTTTGRDLLGGEMTTTMITTGPPDATAR